MKEKECNCHLCKLAKTPAKEKLASMLEGQEITSGVPKHLKVKHLGEVKGEESCKVFIDEVVDSPKSYNHLSPQVEDYPVSKDGCMGGGNKDGVIGSSGSTEPVYGIDYQPPQVELADGVTVKKSDIEKMRLSGNGGGMHYGKDSKVYVNAPQVEEWVKEFDELFIPNSIKAYSDRMDIETLGIPITIRNVKQFIKETVLKDQEKQRGERTLEMYKQLTTFLKLSTYSPRERKDILDLFHLLTK